MDERKSGRAGETGDVERPSSTPIAPDQSVHGSMPGPRRVFAFPLRTAASPPWD